jgi:hypothetical protein
MYPEPFGRPLKRDPFGESTCNCKRQEFWSTYTKVV